jgi:Flp pilus assembly protein TadB
MTSLVGDPERDRTAHELNRHYREGRISVEELAERLETALHARTGMQLRSALSELPGATRRWATPEAVRETLRSPAKAVRNAAILAGTAVVWLFWSIGMLAAFVAWLAANGPSLGALVVFPLLWFGVSWLLWSTSKRRRSRG